MIETDSVLVARVRNPADSAGWREFVALYEPLLQAYVRRLGLPERDLQDVVQEIFIKLLQALPQFELDRLRGRFRTWLYSISRNTVVDWLRRRRELPAADSPVELWDRAEAAALSQSEDEWNREYRQRVVEHVLQRVREQAQPMTWACFEQHVLKNWPAAKVAEEFGLTANAVYVNASRILARVREQCLAYAEVLDGRSQSMPA